MKSFTPELKKILHAAGCRFIRHGKGDHEIGKVRPANTVLKQAGLPLSFVMAGRSPSPIRVLAAAKTWITGRYAKMRFALLGPGMCGAEQ